MAQVSYLDRIRTQELIDEIKRRLSTQAGSSFVGTEDDWGALTPEQQAHYDVAYITNDYYAENTPNYIVAAERPGGEYIEGNFWFVTNDETVTEFAGLTSSKTEKIYRYLTDEETNVTSWQVITPTKSPDEPIAYENKLWIKTNENTGLFEGIYICTAVSPEAVWSEIYPTADAGQTLCGVYVDTREPVSLGTYWFAIDSEENRALKGLYQYSRIESADVWELIYKIEAGGGGGVGEDIGNHSERFNDYENNTASGSYGYLHIEGSYNTATGGYYTSIGGYGNSFAGGYTSDISGWANTVAYAYCSLISGDTNTVTSASNCGVFGYKNNVNSTKSIIGGEENTLNSGTDDDIVCGSHNTVSGDYHIVAGYGNTVSANYNIVGGQGNTVSGIWDIVTGMSNVVIGVRSLVVGEYNELQSGGQDSIVCGVYNIGEPFHALVCGEGANISTSDRIIVGNGTSGSPANCFRVNNEGEVYAAEYNTSGADYAEYFEWSDGNSGNENRRGLLVQLVGDKIAPANGDDILGAVSTRPSVCGNTYEEYWQGKYQCNSDGEYIFDENGKPKLSLDFDPKVKYIPRSQRSEWATVGLVGRLTIRDDGTCKPGDWVMADNGYGIPVNSSKKTNVRCLKRIDKKHIEVLIK